MNTQGGKRSPLTDYLSHSKKSQETKCLSSWKSRNKSWTDIYTHIKEENSSVELYSSSHLNHLLTSRLHSASDRLSAFQATFTDLIQALPSHSLLLQRLKSGYEEELAEYKSRLTAGSLLKKDVEDMIELQQLEKQTLLNTIRDLKREIWELNSALLKKTSKLAEVERKLVDIVVSRSTGIEKPAPAPLFLTVQPSVLRPAVPFLLRSPDTGLTPKAVCSNTLTLSLRNKQCLTPRTLCFAFQTNRHSKMEQLPQKLFKPFPRHAEPLNPELTEQAVNDPVQQRYVAWLQSNGILYPKLQYPCAFGAGLLGVGAKEDIAPETAIMFIPYSSCLSLSYAHTTPLKSIFLQYPELFKYHKDALDYQLFVTLLFERLKGEGSFWKPLLDTIAAPEMALDWTQEELLETQDPLLIHEVRQSQFDRAKKWLEVKEVAETHPELFPCAEESLYTEFLWAYAVVYTRTFDVGHPRGMLIPLAVNMNHGEFDMTYLEKPLEWLQSPASEEKLRVDYSSFDGCVQRVTPETEPRAYRSKLLKYLRTHTDGGQLSTLDTIDAVDGVLKGYLSSSDEDDDDRPELTDSDSDSESPATSYFVVVTGKRCFYPRNSQIFTRYGREGNRELLMNFAFAMKDNCRDCVKIRLWDEGFEGEGHKGTFPSGHFSKQLKDNASLYKVRKHRLNEDLLTYSRKKVLQELRQEVGLEESLRTLMYTVPSEELIELQTIRRTIVLLQAVQRNRFPSSVETDKALLRTPLPPRLRFAVRTKQVLYRLAQQKILRNQLELLGLLRDLFEEICAGRDVMEVTATHGDIRKIYQLYPLRIYLRRFRMEREWRLQEQFRAAGLPP